MALWSVAVLASGQAASLACRALVLAAALAILAFAVLARVAPEVERGRLLPFFEDYEVVRVRLLDVEFYADTSSGMADLLTVSALAGVACILASVALRLARRGGAHAGSFAVAAAGAAFLSADDLLAAHESVGHNLGFLAALPAIDHPDDVIVGVYAIVVVAFAWSQRRLAAKTPRWPWLVCLVAASFAVGHDVLSLHLSVAEEAAEVLAALALLTGVSFVAARHAAYAPSAAPVGAEALTR